MSGSLRAHIRPDDDAAIDRQPRLLGQPRIRLDPDRHDHQRRRDHRAALEFDALDATVAENGLGVGLGEDLDAAPLQLALQEISGGRVELAFHQRRHEMHDGDVHVPRPQASRRFEPQQPAADHDRLVPRPRREQHRRDVVEVAIGDYAGKIIAGHRDDERVRAGGDNELIVRHRLAMFRRHRFIGAIDPHDLMPLIEHDAVLDVPAIAMDDDLFIVLLTGQHRREHDPVVIDARLGIEDGDVVGVGCIFEQMFEHASRRHAVTDDDEFFGHWFCPHAALCSEDRSARLALMASSTAGSGLAPPS